MSAINLSTASVYSSALQQKSQNVNNMFSALKAGDLAKAQEAYASSGLPPMATNNTSPLGRLYNALCHDDLKSAQQAALDMQWSKAGKDTGSTNTSGGTKNTSPTTDPKAQIKATALELVKQSKAQSSASALLGLGNNVNLWG